MAATYYASLQTGRGTDKQWKANKANTIYLNYSLTNNFIVIFIAEQLYNEMPNETIAHKDEKGFKSLDWVIDWKLDYSSSKEVLSISVL